MTEVWQTAFIPDSSCVEEVTVLEKQMIRVGGEDDADSWTKPHNLSVEGIKIRVTNHSQRKCKL